MQNRIKCAFIAAVALLLASAMIAPSGAITFTGGTGMSGWVEAPSLFDVRELERVVVTGNKWEGWRENMMIVSISAGTNALSGPSFQSTIDPKDLGFKYPEPKPTQTKSECVADCNTEQAMANDLCDVAAAQGYNDSYGTAKEIGLITVGIGARGGFGGTVAGIPGAFAVYKGVKTIGDDAVANVSIACRGVASKAHYDCLKDRCHA